jgi:glycosyltransferase involved in cell wall biosynthesis
MANSLPANVNLGDSLQGVRIVFVLEMLELGGAERQALLLARYLKNEVGADVRVVGFNSPGRAARLCEQYGIEWSIIPVSIQTGRRKRYRAPFVFARGLRALKPDVLLPYTVSPNVLCGIVWRWTGAKSCIWNQRDEGTERVDRLFERLSVRMMPRFLANSQGGAGFLTKVLGAKEHCVSIIHNGIQLAQPVANRADWRNRLGISDDCFVACMIANFRWPKDHATLIRAWRVVVDRLPSHAQTPVLLLAGRFDGTAEMAKSLTDELKLGGAVRFLGPVDDIPGLLRSVDLGVLSSESEGMPNGVLESMAVGLPFVGTDVSGIHEAVGPGCYEYLAPLGNVEVLAELICRFAESPELRAAQGMANAKRIADEFLPDVMCRRTAQVISDTLGNGGSK